MEKRLICQLPHVTLRNIAKLYADGQTPFTVDQILKLRDGVTQDVLMEINGLRQRLRVVGVMDALVAAQIENAGLRSGDEPNDLSRVQQDMETALNEATRPKAKKEEQRIEAKAALSALIAPACPKPKQEPQQINDAHCLTTGAGTDETVRKHLRIARHFRLDELAEFLATVPFFRDFQVADFFKNSHRHYYANARSAAFVIMHAPREEGGYKCSLPAVGKFFTLHHTSVLYGIQRYAELVPLRGLPPREELLAKFGRSVPAAPLAEPTPVAPESDDTAASLGVALTL